MTTKFFCANCGETFDKLPVRNYEDAFEEEWCECCDEGEDSILEYNGKENDAEINEKRQRFTAKNPGIIYNPWPEGDSEGQSEMDNFITHKL